MTKESRKDFKATCAAYVILSVILIAAFYQSMIANQSVTAKSRFISSSSYAGVLKNRIIVITNNSVRIYVIANFTPYFAIALSNNLIAASGNYLNHPALALLNTSRATSKLIIGSYNGSLFSITVLGNKSIIASGYVIINDSYAGLILKVSSISGSNGISNYYMTAYLSSEPIYFRDIEVLNNKLLIATGVGFCGKYYPGLSIISGSDREVKALVPRITGFKGFQIKAIVIAKIKGAENPYVIALKGGKVYLVGFAKGLVNGYILKSLDYCVNVLPIHTPSGTIVVFRTLSMPLLTYMPDLKSYFMPASTRVILVNELGKVTPLDMNFKVLRTHYRSLKLAFKSVKLEEFSLYSNELTIEKVNLSVRHVSLRATTVGNTMTAGTRSEALLTTHHEHVTMTTVKYGYSPEIKEVNVDVRPLVIGIVLIIIAYLIKRFLSVH